MSFNVWGLPSKGEVDILDVTNFSSQYKEERMKAIGKEVAKGEYDLYLFQELWMPEDYKKIKESIPDGFHVTKDLDFTDPSPKCALQDCLPLCKFQKYQRNLKYYSRRL